MTGAGPGAETEPIAVVDGSALGGAKLRPVLTDAKTSTPPRGEESVERERTGGRTTLMRVGVRTTEVPEPVETTEAPPT